MPNFEVSDCVFSLQPHEWKCIVSGRIHGPFNSRGAAEAGMQTEQRREAARAETAYLSMPTNTPIETVLSTLGDGPECCDPNSATSEANREHEQRRLATAQAACACGEVHDYSITGLPANDYDDPNGTIRRLEQRRMDAIAAELTKFGYEATTEDTGGGIICIKIDGFPANGDWLFGTANDTWGGTFWERDGGADNLETDCSTDESDPAKVAAAIHAAFRRDGFLLATVRRDTPVKAMAPAPVQAPVVPDATAPLYMAALNSFWLTVLAAYPNADRVVMPQTIAQAFEQAAAGVVEAWINAYSAGGYSAGSYGG